MSRGPTLRPPPRRERYAVILAGGSGTRFWPRSRRRVPKQLLRVLGRRSLLQATADRLRGLVPSEHVLVVTHRDHAAGVRRQLPELPHANVLVEPVGRNTAPCLALAALEVERRTAGAVLVSVPADHAIADAGEFRATLLEALTRAAHEPVVVAVGIRPTAAETGYGYIRLGGHRGRRAYRVRAFVEKPTQARARRFVASGDYLWNSGIFACQAGALLGLLDRFLPEVTGPLREAARAPRRTRHVALARAYVRVPSVSIDYGVMEKAPDTVVVAGAFGWSDVGSWAALADIAGAADGRTPVIPVDAPGHAVFGSGRLVALVGVQDLIVVDTADALLVCHRGRTQEVRRVVEEIGRRGLVEYL